MCHLLLGTPSRKKENNCYIKTNRADVDKVREQHKPTAHQPAAQTCFENPCNKVSYENKKLKAAAFPVENGLG